MASASPPTQNSFKISTKNVWIPRGRASYLQEASKRTGNHTGGEWVVSVWLVATWMLVRKYRSEICWWVECSDCLFCVGGRTQTNDVAICRSLNKRSSWKLGDNVPQVLVPQNNLRQSEGLKLEGPNGGFVVFDRTRSHNYGNDPFY